MAELAFRDGVMEQIRAHETRYEEGAYLFVLPAVLRFTVFKRMYEQMGGLRYGVMIFLLLLMALMPIKMVLRWLFNLKYFIYLPEFSANL